MRSPALLFVFCLMFPVLAAGCAGTSDDAGDAAQAALTEAAPGVYVLSDRGAVMGRVANEANLSVSGARVSLLGDDMFADTGRDGRFSFLNVTPGQRTLFVQHQDYASLEVPVMVTAANVTVAEIHLLPREDRGAGYVPHTHDLWGGAEEYVLMDEDVVLTPSPRDTNTANAYVTGQVRANSNQSWPLPIPSGPNEQRIVLPGTKEMRVTFTWNSQQITLPRLGFAYRAPGATGITYLEPKASGGTWTIAVSPSMADNGHQRFSLWSLLAYSANTYTAPTAFAPGVVNGPLRVNVVLVRGEVTLDQAHTNFWKDTDTRVLRDVSKGELDGVLNRGRTTSYGLRLDKGQIVPPGTGSLRIEFRVVYNAQESVNVLDWDLTWRTGGQNPQVTTLSQFSRATPETNQLQYKVWQITLKPEDTDAFYQTESNWLFVPWPKPWPEEGTFYEPRARTLYLGVTAFKDPAYGG